MKLTELPVEIGAYIFTYLDLKTKINVYSIKQLRHFFTPCVIRKIDISRSTVASAKTLGLDLFQDLPMNIRELNLSGISDLTSPFLSEHIQRFTNLKTLDVTFTQIYLSDLKDICCESLKNIHINFFQPLKYAKDKIWMQTSEVFKRQKFEIVHFVVLDFHCSDSPYEFMEDVPMPKELKITLAHYYEKRHRTANGIHMCFLTDDFEKRTFINFEKLIYNIRDCQLADIIPDNSALLRKLFNLDYEKIEYIFIMYSETIKMFVSPKIHGIFSQLICKDLSINVSSQLALNVKLDGNIVFHAWNKDAIVFDNEFFNNLLIEFTDYFPTFVCTKSKENTNITKAPSHWYCLDKCKFEETVDNLPEKVSLSDSCRSLTDDAAVAWYSSRHDWSPTPVAIEANENLTFLSFNNICWFDDFYGVLFKECKRLHTLDVSIECNKDDYNCGALRLLDSLCWTKSLRNLRIMTESVVYYHRVFDCLSECPTLENVHISETGQYYEYETDISHLVKWVNRQNIPPLIEKCCNLYSLFIQANLDKEVLTLLEDSLNFSARRFGRDYLHVKICISKGGWNPFADVFSPSPLHIKN